MLNLTKQECVVAAELIEYGAKTVGYSGFLAAAVLIDKLRQEVNRLEEATESKDNAE